MQRLALVLLLGSLVGCGISPKAETPNTSEVDFIQAGNASLMGRVKLKSMDFCLRGVAEGDRDAWGDSLKDVMKKWVRPLRALTAAPLVDRFNIVQPSQPCHVDVIVETGHRAETYITSRPQVFLDSSGWYGSYGVILHEFGHVMGLLDTYVPGASSGNCQAGQPQAVMCNMRFDDLQPDDIRGLSRVFQSYFPNEKPPTNPPADKQAEFDKFRFALALGAQEKPNTFKIAVGMSGNVDQPNAVLALCLGNADECRQSGSGWRDLTSGIARGDAKIYLDSEATTFTNSTDVTIRYKNEEGSVYQTFAVSSGSPS